MNIMLALVVYQDRLVFSLLDWGIQKKLSSQLYSFFCLLSRVFWKRAIKKSSKFDYFLFFIATLSCYGRLYWRCVKTHVDVIWICVWFILMLLLLNFNYFLLISYLDIFLWFFVFLSILFLFHFGFRLLSK